jgi:arsenate reductase
MAEGWTQHLKGDVIDAFSAGTESHGLNFLAVKVMAEAGVDISYHSSKTLTDLSSPEFDYVITVCSDADRNCPVMPVPTKKIHRGFDDPPRLAHAAASEEEALVHYRRVRDEIRAFVETLPESLEQNRDSES